MLPDALVMMRAVPIMAAMLRRGFTTVRDAGGAGWGLKCAVEEGTLVGPRLFISGRAISQTGGHGDPPPPLGSPAPDELLRLLLPRGRHRPGGRRRRRACARRCARNCRWGPTRSRSWRPAAWPRRRTRSPSFGYSEDEIRAIVAEARGRQTYVLAHAYTAEAISRAVKCGVRTIEHGNLIDEDAAAVMAAHGAYVVPTPVTYEALANEGADYGLPPDSVAKIATVRTAGLHSLEIYKRAGVKMGYGSDLLGPSQRLQSDEFRLRAQVPTPHEVIQSATSIAAEVLRMDDRLGRIVPGAIADVLVVDGNLYKDVSCLLGQGDHIPLVMKDGKIFHDMMEA